MSPATDGFARRGGQGSSVPGPEGRESIPTYGFVHGALGLWLPTGMRVVAMRFEQGLS